MRGEMINLNSYKDAHIVPVCIVFYIQQFEPDKWQKTKVITILSLFLDPEQTNLWTRTHSVAWKHASWVFVLIRLWACYYFCKNFIYF